ncbi:AAA family ATPase [Streptomyces sp. NBC_00257]|uniref:UvrD-helicase domain-containing protein n=1 Tax=unclassified Streptomyces TaxID=2593676 RepID=UPI0022530184|nr:MULTISPECIES: UvrD-helicase domain-containing protein [unclassified Streptomyces]MCX5428422.1 AAA family ATPase [Streptomyces sp. NBC_00062]
MPQIAITNTFWEGVDRLDKPARVRVHKAMAKFQQLTIHQLHSDKGLHLESVVSARDPRMRTVRVDDGLRIVLLAPDDGSDLFTFVHVVPHDKAYSWARRRLYTINAVTRCLEVRDLTAMEQITPLFAEEAEAAPRLLFASWTDATLHRLGVDDVTLRAARTITGKAQLEAFGKLMPEDQFEALWLLAEGFEADAVYRDLVAARQSATVEEADEPKGELAAAVSRTRSRIALVTGPEELADILTKPFDAWRIFLHPSQRRIAYRPSYAGPVQITGGPGTGKTVVALHRVKHLLDRAPDTRILLTTYTGALARSLRSGLALLLDQDQALLDRVTVTTVDALARRTVSQLDRPPGTILGDKDERRHWQRTVRTLELPWSEAFLAQEYRHVLLAQDLRSSEEYAACRRRGRGSALGKAQREQVWEAMTSFEDGLVAGDRACTWLQLCARATRLLADKPGEGLRFDHVVVDEAQDLHPAQWRLLRAVVAEGDDDLFVTGDPHQRIYDARVSLRSLGISVAGRGARLRLNYRSTEEILRWSKTLLDGEPVDDLSGDDSDSLSGYRSLLHGKRPECEGHGTEAAEVDAIVKRVGDWVADGVAPSEIAVCARFRTHTTRIADRLAAAGLPVVRVKDDETGDAVGVRVSSLHSLKGLEFRCVAVAGVTASAFPFRAAVTPAEVDPLQHATDLAAERCLLFVACTRAREALYVSHSGRASEFLDVVGLPANSDR